MSQQFLQHPFYQKDQAILEAPPHHRVAAAMEAEFRHCPYPHLAQALDLQKQVLADQQVLHYSKVEPVSLRSAPSDHQSLHGHQRYGHKSISSMNLLLYPQPHYQLRWRQVQLWRA